MEEAVEERWELAQRPCQAVHVELADINLVEHDVEVHGLGLDRETDLLAGVCDHLAQFGRCRSDLIRGRKDLHLRKRLAGLGVDPVLPSAVRLIASILQDLFSLLRAELVERHVLVVERRDLRNEAAHGEHIALEQRADDVVAISKMRNGLAERLSIQGAPAHVEAEIEHVEAQGHLHVGVGKRLRLVDVGGLGETSPDYALAAFKGDPAGIRVFDDRHNDLVNVRTPVLKLHGSSARNSGRAYGQGHRERQSKNQAILPRHYTYTSLFVCFSSSDIAAGPRES